MEEVVQELLRKIESTRRKLADVTLARSLFDEEVVRISRELDELILEYDRLKKLGE